MKNMNLGSPTRAITPNSINSTPSKNSRESVNDSLFRDQLSALTSTAGTAPMTAPTPLKFSNHAIDRMQARGIRFSEDEMTNIESAVKKAEAKGAKNTLLVSDKNALIVSVKDKTVVTVMDKAQLKDNVFTNIDSTVVI